MLVEEGIHRREPHILASTEAHGGGAVGTCVAGYTGVLNASGAGFDCDNGRLVRCTEVMHCREVSKARRVQGVTQQRAIVFGELEQVRSAARSRVLTRRKHMACLAHAACDGTVYPHLLDEMVPLLCVYRAL